MVAPLVAAGRGAAGTSTKAAGGNSAKSLQAKSRSRDAKGRFVSEKSTTDIFKELTKMKFDFIGKFSAQIELFKKIFNVLAKASPALAQQFIILRKSLLLILRPIGDIMAKFLRPMAVWMIKFATKWYDIFGTGAGSETPAGLEDKLAGLESEKITAQAAGDMGRVDDIQKNIDKIKRLLDPTTFEGLDFRLRSIFGKLYTTGYDFGMKIQGIYDDFIAPAFASAMSWVNKIWTEKLSPAWEEAKLWTQFIWEKYLQPVWEDIKTKISEAFAPIKTWLVETWTKYVAEPFAKVSEFLDKLWSDYVVAPFMKIDAWLLSMWTTYVVAPFGKFDGWVNSLWASIQSAFNKLISRVKSWDPFSGIKKEFEDWKKEKGFATGGAISESGLYQLHAGERVMTAGEVSRNTESNSTSINNTFNITASISNDIDIQVLARKLARLNETELRRRSSYI